MKRLTCYLAWLFTLSLFAQTEKGVSPVKNELNPEQTHQETYAVVVGISDYQDESIPDLRFADKDALAFAGFLQSPAGGSLGEDHLKVLINEQATGAQFAKSLDWLWEVARENDRVIIYFSGHGDVEKKSITQPGYLLGWDAPSRVYMAGGAMNVRDLNDVISTLSLRNKTKVILITDACRAGKLSGSGIGGAQATAANLAQQFVNEIKILSCQPDEYSIEGEQWGGGRGVFSYHLLDGLSGLADRNSDQSVSLMEVRGYLEEKVPTEVAPQSQLPMVIGNGREKLTDVFPEILDQLKNGKKGQLQLFTSIESKGIEDEVLEAADSNILEMYLAFKESLSQKNFICDSSELCADFYYEKLSNEPQLEKLHSSIRRNYAAALQDDAQQVMNRLLNSHPLEVNKTLYAKNKNYGSYPQLLRRSAELLGEDHYIYRHLMARSYWFEGYLEDNITCFCFDETNAKKVLSYYKKALEYQPEMPHAWLQMALVYGIQLKQRDSMEYYANLAIDAIPQWIAAYYWAGYSYSIRFWGSRGQEDISNGKRWLEKGLMIDSSSVLLLSELGDLFAQIGEFKKAEKYLRRALTIHETAHTLEYLGWCYFHKGEFQKAEQAWLRATELDSTYFNKFVSNFAELYAVTNQGNKIDTFWNTLVTMYPPTAGMYSELGKGLFRYCPRKALPILKKSVEMDPTDPSALSSLSLNHSYLDDGDEAEELDCAHKAFTLAPQNPSFANNIALIYLRQNEIKLTEKYSRIGLALVDNEYPNGILSMLYFQNGMIDKANERLRIGMEKNAKKLLSYFGFCARRYLMNPDLTSDYLKHIEKLYPDNPLVNLANAVDLVVFKNDKEQAFMELEKSIQKGVDKQSLIRGYHIPLKLEKNRWNDLVRERFPELIIE